MVAVEGKNCLHSSAHDRVPLLAPVVKCPKLRLRIRGQAEWHGAHPGLLPTENIHQKGTSSTNETKGNHSHHLYSIILRPGRHTSASRPLSTYTSLGSPLPRGPARARSKSLGHHPNEGVASPTTTSSSSPSAYQQHNHGGGSPKESEPSTSSPEHLHGSPTHGPNQQSSPLVIADDSPSTVALERVRQMEAAEVNCTADELRAILRKERLQRRINVEQHGTTEQLEAEILAEGQLQGMMQHLDVLQEEKGRMAAEIQREEELMKTTLRVRLDLVRKSNEALRQRIKAECEVNEALKSHWSQLRGVTKACTASTDDEGDSDVVMDEQME